MNTQFFKGALTFVLLQNVYSIFMSLVYIILSNCIGTPTSLFIVGGIVTTFFSAIVFIYMNKLTNIKTNMRFVFVALVFILLIVIKALMQNWQSDSLAVLTIKSKDEFRFLIQYITGLTSLFYFWLIFCMLFYYRKIICWLIILQNKIDHYRINLKREADNSIY